MEVVTQNAQETKALGKEIGNKLGQTPYNKQHKHSLSLRGRKNAVVLALMGDLGSGKTTFLQGLAKGLGIKQRIISPTFIIVRTYNIQHTTKKKKPKTVPQSGITLRGKDRRLKTFYHIDLYRLETNIEREVQNLGMDEIMSDPSNIVAIEWAEKMKDYLPKSTQWIKFEYSGKDKRRIRIDKVR